MIDFNQPSTWINEQLHDEPPFDKAAHQRAVDSVCGLAPNGQSNVVLTWIPAMENYSRWCSEWDAAGNGVKTELRAQYVYTTIDDGTHFLEIPPPRWAYKQRIDAAQYALTDERLRWRRSESNFRMELTAQGLQSVPQQVKQKELRPPRPLDGYYAPLATVALHDGYCCAESKRKKQLCWGGYREPGEDYLNMLRIAVAKRDAETNAQSPYEPLSNETLKEAAREAAEYEEEKARESDELLDAELAEHMPEIMEYIFGREIKQEGKAYSLPSGFTKSPSGLIVPK